MTMTLIQFETIAILIRGTRDCPANRAARRVLVDGLSQADAMRECDIKRGTVNKAVRRFEKAYVSIREAFCE
jgi:hypothetical protein